MYLRRIPSLLTKSLVFIAWLGATACSTTNNVVDSGSNSNDRVAVDNAIINQEQIIQSDIAAVEKSVSIADTEIETTTEPTVIELFGVGPGGGIVFQLNDAGTSGLEVSPVLFGAATYGCEGEIVGAFELSGEINSASLLNNNCIASAAVAASSFTSKSIINFNGAIADDWFLPSAAELFLLFSQGLIPKFPNGGPFGYWSSNEINEDTALLFFINGDGAGDNAKSVNGLVLPVRSFSN